MNTRLSDRLSFYSAIGMGLGVSTGHPLGIMAAGGMPVACLAPATRKAAFKSTLGYYAAGLWPMVPGSQRYIGKSTSLLIPVALWAIATMVLAVPWAMAWTSGRRLRCLWRVPLALMATVVPPLGMIGYISPLTAAGYLFPGTAWVGLTAVAVLPGIFHAAYTFSGHRRCAVLCLAVGSCVGLAIASRVLAPLDPEPIPRWVAVNTHFGNLSEPFRDFHAAELIQQKAADASARVLIFPESVVPRWSDSTAAFWHESLERARSRGQILAIGAGLPARSGNVRNDRAALGDLRTYDFGAAIDLLNDVDLSPLRDRRGSVIPSQLNDPRPEPLDNALLVVGAESSAFYQRVPVPIGMWRPFSKISVPLRLGSTGVLAIDHQRAAILICYEQMIVFPVLASILEHPTVIVGISNTFWFDDTSIPRYQATALRGWARLFRLPLFLAVNS